MTLDTLNYKMGQKIAIVGEPTKGKSTSILPNEELKIKGLTPEETIIISFSGKMLPIRGANKMYPKDKKISEGGRFMHLTDVKMLPKLIEYISTSRPEVKNIVLEDMQYSMANEFMSRAKENGFGKFVDIGVNFSNWMRTIQESRDNLYVWIIWHPEKDNAGNMKMKTIGNMVDTYLTPEGMMDLIFYADCEKSTNGKMNYFLVTNNDGRYPARTPNGMFKDLHIPNDLGLVRECLDEYYN